MALRLANPAVIAKVEHLAKATGLSKTAVVDEALDRLIVETLGHAKDGQRLMALLAQIDRVPERADAFDPMKWGEHGLPR